MDSPMAADYSLNSLSLESGADNGTAAYSENDAAAAAHSTDHAKIIYTANLSLESKDYDAARAALDAAAAEAGGYMESSSEYSGTEDSRSVSLTFRVPQQNYASFLAAVAEAGNVTYKNQQADDVTAQYMDVEARLENLKAQRTRLQQLQQQARDPFRPAGDRVQPDRGAEPDRELAEPDGLVQQSGGAVHRLCEPERGKDLLAAQRELCLPHGRRICQRLAELCTGRAAAGRLPRGRMAGGGHRGGGGWRRRSVAQKEKMSRPGRKPENFFRKGLTSIPLCGIILEQSERAAESTK